MMLAAMNHALKMGLIGAASGAVGGVLAALVYWLAKRGRKQSKTRGYGDRLQQNQTTRSGSKK